MAFAEFVGLYYIIRNDYTPLGVYEVGHDKFKSSYTCGAVFQS